MPNAKRNISLFGNKLLSRLFDIYKERAGGNPSVMKNMFIAERDRQYAVLQGVKRCEASYDYLISDNPACAGCFCVRNATQNR